MARKFGSRSHDHAEKRAELASRIYRCLSRDGARTFHGIAQYIGVSRPTLRHYFGDRDGAVRAAVELAASVGSPRLQAVAEIEAETAEQAVREGLEYLIVAWRDHGLGRLHRVGLQAGLGEADTGRTYLRFALDPLLEVFAVLLRRLRDEGKLPPETDPEGLALTVVSPVYVALLHQHALGGKESEPLRMGAILDEVVARVSVPRTPARPPGDPFAP